MYEDGHRSLFCWDHFLRFGFAFWCLRVQCLSGTLLWYCRCMYFLCYCCIVTGGFIWQDIWKASYVLHTLTSPHEMHFLFTELQSVHRFGSVCVCGDTFSDLIHLASVFRTREIDLRLFYYRWTTVSRGVTLPKYKSVVLNEILTFFPPFCLNSDYFRQTNPFIYVSFLPLSLGIKAKCPTYSKRSPRVSQTITPLHTTTIRQRIDAAHHDRAGATIHINIINPKKTVYHVTRVWKSTPSTLPQTDEGRGVRLEADDVLKWTPYKYLVYRWHLDLSLLNLV